MNNIMFSKYWKAFFSMPESNPKPSMMRFEPNSGWSSASNDEASFSGKNNLQNNVPASQEKITTEELVNLGKSMQQIFKSLKEDDPRVQAWNQVSAAIKLINSKLDEKNSLEEKLKMLLIEIEGVRALTSELVLNAYQTETKVLENSKQRMQLAESLSEKLLPSIKN
tara:strand:+ start:314 stop:814 length:501 start_codon:yes stop_codon:yes gene_type:complete